MALYRCEVCDYIYDEDKEGKKWEDLPDDWECPICGSDKSEFVLDEESDKEQVEKQNHVSTNEINDLIRKSDDLETYMKDIHYMSETGKSITEAMKTKKSVISWDDILIKGAQLSKIPLNGDEPVSTKTVIGPAAKYPLVIETPIIISHMSFGALSREAKLSLAKGSAAVKTAMCSGEGGILPDSMNSSYKYIFEYVPNKYSVNDDILKKVDAIEIKIGQSAKPGMGGHLPGDKVTEEIAKIRGFEKGKDIISPSAFPEIKNKEDLKTKVDWLREKSGGKPIGIKIAAGHIDDDLEIALYAFPDFITIDGRPGATAAAPKYIKAATSIPTIFSLYHARKYLEMVNANHVSLIITGGLRVSSDFAKALALGADVIAIASAALIAIGCQQYRICNTGKCPMGIATQSEELRQRLDIEQASNKLHNFLNVSTNELKTFARLTGNNNIHNLSIYDLATVNSEISKHTEISHV